MLSRLSPDQWLSSVFALDLEGLSAAGIRGLIFDLDNTLGPWGFTAWEPGILAWLDHVAQQGLSLGFLSNDAGYGRQAVRAGVERFPLRFSANKPRRWAYRAMLDDLGAAPGEVAMVGDQIFTDILGAKRLGLYTILVEPFDPSLEKACTLAKRRLELGILRLSGCSRVG